MCKESNEDDTKETLQNNRTKGTHESSVGVLVRVHMLQVGVHVKHVVVLVALRIRVVMSVVVNVPICCLLPVLEFPCQLFTLRKRVFRGAVFAPPIGYSRPPSAVNDQSATK